MSAPEGLEVKPPGFMQVEREARKPRGQLAKDPDSDLPFQAFSPLLPELPTFFLFLPPTKRSFPQSLPLWEMAKLWPPHLLYGNPFSLIWLKINFIMFKFSKSRLASFQMALGNFSKKPLTVLAKSAGCWDALLTPKPGSKKLCISAAFLKAF